MTAIETALTITGFGAVLPVLVCLVALLRANAAINQRYATFLVLLEREDFDAIRAQGDLARDTDYRKWNRVQRYATITTGVLSAATLILALLA